MEWGCGGCNPLGRYRLFLSHKVLKCQEIIHFSVFIPIRHCFSFSDIFLEGSQDPKDPLDPPLRQRSNFAQLFMQIIHQNISHNKPLSYILALQTDHLAERCVCRSSDVPHR